MAHHKSALKRIRTSRKRRMENRHNRSKLHSLTKAVHTAESKETAQAALNNAMPVIDKMAAKGLIHKNKAANRKSRLAKYVNKIS